MAGNGTSEQAQLGMRRAPALIADDFLAEGIQIDRNKIFPMLVMGTMSSGKSTLINALLRKQILPSENFACTAKSFSILDDDDEERASCLYITDTAGKMLKIDENIEEELARANRDESVSDIFLRDHVKGVLNTDRALLIIDTPGPNHSSDISHEKVMRRTLDKVHGGLILYVMNATQMATNDDKHLLCQLNCHLQKHPALHILFVINQIDQLDEEKGESVERVVTSTREYLVENGFRAPHVIPVSALTASVLEKALNEETLTRKEYKMFTYGYDLFVPKEFHYDMKVFAITEDRDPFAKVTVRGNAYKVSNIVRAIENTGIRLLEECIQKAQILSGEQLKITL